MPKTVIRTEPDYKDIKNFLKEFLKFKGDCTEVDKKEKEE